MRETRTRRHATAPRARFEVAATGIASGAPVHSTSPSPMVVLPAAGHASAHPEAPAATGSTIVTLGASPASPAALAVGESVTVTPAASDSAATGVTVLLVRVTGTVSSVTRDPLTVSTADGVDVTIVTTPSTTVTLDGSPAAPPTLAVGDHVTAEGLITPPPGRVSRRRDHGARRAPASPHLGHGPAWALIHDWFSATSLSVGADLSAS
ncbi:MAG TPA: DUF5666 domain-containing protein [Acidimicrobiales bacterium]|nr:DUF5666 domain-containing protein [Acidimicrobiales bacterium]